MRIGLPRALLYYWYGPAWKTFFQEIGHTPVVSSTTNKDLLKQGVRVSVEEACLPVKIFFGHCLSLLADCDLLMVPRIINVAKREFICPKFMGLPDMVRRVIADQYGEKPILVWKSDHEFFWDSPPALPRELHKLTGRREIHAALRQAKQVWREYVSLLRQGYLPDAAEKKLAGKTVNKPEEKGETGIGVIGHPYCLYDSFLNMDLLSLLQKGTHSYRVFTPEIFSEQEISAEIADLPKPIFWTLGRRMLGAARALRKKGVAGLIHIAAFACGPEALIGELIRRECQNHRLPLLQINIDEHSGEAGLLTRVEAFLDLITGRAYGREETGCG